jgi:hypothetical protein
MDDERTRDTVLAIVDVLESMARTDDDPAVEDARFLAIHQLLESGVSAEEARPIYLGLAVRLAQWWSEDTGRPVAELFERLRSLYRYPSA